MIRCPVQRKLLRYTWSVWNLWSRSAVFPGQWLPLWCQDLSHTAVSDCPRNFRYALHGSWSAAKIPPRKYRALLCYAPTDSCTPEAAMWIFRFRDHLPLTPWNPAQYRRQVHGLILSCLLTHACHRSFRSGTEAVPLPLTLSLSALPVCPHSFCPPLLLQMYSIPYIPDTAPSIWTIRIRRTGRKKYLFFLLP